VRGSNSHLLLTKQPWAPGLLTKHELERVSEVESEPQGLENLRTAVIPYPHWWRVWEPPPPYPEGPGGYSPLDASIGPDSPYLERLP
jgi:hypothetical protein